MTTTCQFAPGDLIAYDYKRESEVSSRFRLLFIISVKKTYNNNKARCLVYDAFDNTIDLYTVDFNFDARLNNRI